MSNTIELIAVGDDTLEATRTEDGRVWVVVKRVCESLGLDVPTQRTKLAGQAWAKDYLKTLAIADALGRARETIVIDAEALPMWLAGIDGLRVSPEVRTRLFRFQIEARTVLARHFGAGWAYPSNPRAGSGGATGSGGDSQHPLTTVSARQILQTLQTMTAALTATIDDLEGVRANGEQTRAFAIDTAIELNQRIHEVRKTAESAAEVADRTARAGTQARESRRRIDAAVGVITAAIRKHCTHNALPYQAIYSEVRSDLGLRRTQDGGPALGKAKLRADQVLRLSRTATRLGVPGVGVAVIEAILNGEDGPAPATKPRAITPRADDVVINEGGAQ